MPLILLIIAFAFPRTVILLLWVFSTWWNTVAIDAILGILAFVFMPYTLLWYSVVMNWYGGVWGLWQALFLVLAILLDLSPLFAWRQYYYVEE